MCYISRLHHITRLSIFKRCFMLGISDPYVLSAYVLCILSTLLCVIYGALNWNKGSETETDEIEEELEWEKEEEKMKDEIGTVV